MLRAFMGIFLALHGLVHIWYVALSLGWVKFQPDMGWTGRSWLFTNLAGEQATRWLAAFGYGLAAILFVGAGVGLIAQLGWIRSWLITASILSSATILLFWDGSLSMPVEKGLVGLLINLAILVAVLVFRWPAI